MTVRPTSHSTSSYSDAQLPPTENLKAKGGGKPPKDGGKPPKDGGKPPKEGEKPPKEGEKPPTDNNKGNSDGSNIDVNAPPPTDRNSVQYDEYQQKLQLMTQIKMQQAQEKQDLRAALADIKSWGSENEKVGTDIG